MNILLEYSVVVNNGCVFKTNSAIDLDMYLVDFVNHGGDLFNLTIFANRIK